MNAALDIRSELARAKYIASQYDAEVVEADDVTGGYVWTIGLETEMTEVGRVDLFKDEIEPWLVEPFLKKDTCSVAEAREFAELVERASNLAEALNQPDPDLEVYLAFPPDFRGEDRHHLVTLEDTAPGVTPWVSYSLQTTEWVGRHKVGDRWGRGHFKNEYLGQFDVLRTDTRDGRVIYLLKERA